MRRALVSVTNKEGIVEFCKELETLGFEIVSTGGTLKKLVDEGVKAIPIDDVTKFPEMLDGRVKTLNPYIHGGILYTRDDENLAFDGEPVEIFSEWLTQEEKDALAALKAEYAELKAFKEKYDADELKALKDAIFEMPEYADIKETEEFQALIKEADKYSVEDLRIKADLLFANSMKKKFNFEAEKPENTHSVGVHINAQPDPKKQAYAGLFADEDK
jgi:hypothetical protein